MMARWFDLHLYFANWGERRLMIRLPSRLFDPAWVSGLLRADETATVREAGGNLILDIGRGDLETDYDERDEEDEEDAAGGSGWLTALEPLRDNALAGDLRLFYLIWLLALEDGLCDDDEVEPLPGLGPVDAAIEAFGDFFYMDPDLIAAAAECEPGVPRQGAPRADARTVIAGLDDAVKSRLLLRLVENEREAAIELRALVVQGSGVSQTLPAPGTRTADSLRQRAGAIRAAREAAEAEAAEAGRKRQQAEQEQARRTRLTALGGRGDAVWQEVETEIEGRTAAGYDRAASLLADLKALADQRGSSNDFNHHLQAIQVRHARKPTFLARLAAMG